MTIALAVQKCNPHKLYTLSRLSAHSALLCVCISDQKENKSSQDEVVDPLCPCLLDQRSPQNVQR
ncbi:hypothetical protein N0V91_009654 [Didymella pomorum]|uniref:Uncharacterized protein n=1 Tax=Didymella pomorum TaxID=749634 RepID=A0A9W8Z8P4_9PLEO|nr:hypothetical protein N0V91_009654 [Didymella pomorum]